MGFRVSGFRVQGLGLRVWNSKWTVPGARRGYSLLVNMQASAVKLSFRTLNKP